MPEFPPYARPHKSKDETEDSSARREQLLEGLKSPATKGQKPVLILDGGLGTTLEDDYGIKFSSTSTPTWSSHLLASSPETLLKAHQSFADAGADIILTATYQASLDGFTSTRRVSVGDDFRRRGASSYYSREEAKKLMQSAVPLARSAFGSRKGLVALSLGAYGATMIPSTEYTGEYPAEMQDHTSLGLWHAQRMIGFESDQKTWDQIDLVAFETLPRIEEITAVRGSMQLLSGARRKLFWISCVFPNDEEKLPDGSDVTDVVKAMLEQPDPNTRQLWYANSPVAIGINCTKVRRLPSLIRSFEDAAFHLKLLLPYLVIYPDGATDTTYDAATQKWVPLGTSASSRSWDEEVFEIMQEVKKRNNWAGIIVGGCCKTKPEDIARLRDRLESEV
jgi:homocysteine S-methyltransferase